MPFFCEQWLRSTVQRQKKDDVTEEDLAQVANSASDKKFCKELVGFNSIFLHHVCSDIYLIASEAVVAQGPYAAAE